MDGITMVVAPAIIVLIAGLGCLAPAWMAVRTEPISALREP
jgi:ABC-type lipoprotein release transport system permease subunit